MREPRAGRRPRLVATDLDGTLLGSDGTVSDRTREVLVELQRRDVPVVFVTGRPLRWMDALWPMVGGHGLAIVGNGAVVYDVERREVRRLVGIEQDAGRALLDLIARAVPGVELAVESVDGLRVVTGFSGAAADVAGAYEESWARPATKILVRHPAGDFDETRRAVLAAVASSATVTWSERGLLELSAPGVTKAAALAEVCAELGVDAADVVAFGDMPNDVTMLTWAGTSYAMAGAHPDARAAADHEAPGHDDDGVARVLAALWDLPQRTGMGPTASDLL